MTATSLLRIGRNGPTIVGAANVEGVSTGRGGSDQGSGKAWIIKGDLKCVSIVTSATGVIYC